MMIRNKELDERNRQLGEMVNKAIEMQASAYKTKIMKDVEFGTQKIINYAEEEQHFKEKKKRILKSE